jgi:hypothetical protein
VRPYGFNAETDRLLELASSYWTLGRTDEERRVARVYANSGPIAAKLYVYNLDAVRAAKDSALSLKNKASAGNDWPADYGGHPNEVYLSPTNTYGAMLKTAYWLAVAARYGHPALLTESERLQKKAYDSILTYAFGSGDNYSESVSAIQRIIDGGAASMDAAGARTDGRLTGIYKIFNVQMDPTGISYTKDVRESQSAGRILDNVGNDITNAVYVLRGLVTGEKPPGMSDTEWFFRKWGLRAGIGVVGVGILMVVGRPYVEIAMKALDKVKPDEAPRANRRRGGRNRQ